MIQPSSAVHKVDVRGDVSQVNGGAVAALEHMWQGLEKRMVGVA